MANPDPYYQRSEVSNSDLTALKEILHPRPIFGNREKAFRDGSLVDAVITEPERVNRYRLTVDGEQFSEDEFRWALEMQRALRAEARSDSFLAYVLENAETQKVSINPAMQIVYSGFLFDLAARCKWDFWLKFAVFGGDLKTTACASQREFEEAIDFFDWDRSRAWYMDVAHTDRDFIYAISKKNFKVFRKFINRGDAIYTRGREKYEPLAFMWWTLNLPNLRSA